MNIDETVNLFPFGKLVCTSDPVGLSLRIHAQLVKRYGQKFGERNTQHDVIRAMSDRVDCPKYEGRTHVHFDGAAMEYRQEDRFEEEAE